MLFQNINTNSTIYQQGDYIIKQISSIKNGLIELNLIQRFMNASDKTEQIESYHIGQYSVFLFFKRNSSKLDLFEYNRTYDLSTSEIIDILKQITHWCIDIFNSNLFNGDLKLENILIDIKTKKLSFIDFGHGSIITKNSTYVFGGKVLCPPELLSSFPTIQNVERNVLEWALVWQISQIATNLIGPCHKLVTYIQNNRLDLNQLNQVLLEGRLLRVS